MVGTVFRLCYHLMVLLAEHALENYMNSITLDFWFSCVFGQIPEHTWYTARH